MPKRSTEAARLTAAAIGQRLRSVRIEARLSQRALASQAKLSRQQVDRIERGKAVAKFEAMLEVCHFLDVNPLWLGFGKPEEKLRFVVWPFTDIEGRSFIDALTELRTEYAEYRAKILGIATRRTILANV